MPPPAVPPTGSGSAPARQPSPADPSARHDLLIRGGRAVDPEQGTIRARDVAVRGGRIAALLAPGAPAAAADTLDATGLLVAPGLIDLHTHVFAGHTRLGVAADDAGVRQGVTTVADAGSTGCDAYPVFAAEVVAPAATRVLGWLNISRHGLTRGTGELADPAAVDPDGAAALLRRHPGVLRGLKVRMSGSVLGGSGLGPLRAAKHAAAEAGGVPVMVHVGNEPPPFGEVLDLLGPGDVVTHAFHGKPGGLFGGGPEPTPQARAALRRGVRFDVGHGSASLSFDVLERALAAGIRPHTVSTDLHVRNLHGPVVGLAATLDKLLAAGADVAEAVRCATLAAAESLRLDDGSGTLRPGAPADLSLLELREEPVDLTDADGRHRTGGRRLVPAAAVRGGAVHRIPRRRV